LVDLRAGPRDEGEDPHNLNLQIKGGDEQGMHATLGLE
jgi:hypothetical protein